MSLYSYKNLNPEIAEGCFIAPSADVIGDVKLGNNVSIWYNSVVRGDMDEIVIGENTNIQDLCMLHVDYNIPLHIGKNVTIGHKATLHGCTIGDSCLIGMGAIIMDNAKIGANSLVAAGTIIPPGKEYPPGSFIMGVPGRVKKELTEEEKQLYGGVYKHYLHETSLYNDLVTVKRLD